MATELQVAIDCSDEERQIEFWTQALGYVRQPPPPGFASYRDYWLSLGIPEADLGDSTASNAIVDPDGVGPRICFLPVPEGKQSEKNRLHLDLRITDRLATPYAERRQLVDAEVERLLTLGATHAWTNAPEDADFYGVTLRDPEGNEFCVT